MTAPAGHMGWEPATVMLSTLAIAFGVSADAFAVAAGRGAGLGGFRPMSLLRLGALFGAMEALAFLAGWSFGHLASQAVAAIDHWIAFAVLGGIGVKMIWESLSIGSVAPRPERGMARLALAAAGTSVDTFAVGAALALVEGDVVATAATIGVVTCLMAWTGLVIGRFAGTALGRTAEAVGGGILIAIGGSIVLQHSGMVHWGVWA